MTFVGPIRSEDLNDLVRALLDAAGADSDDARLVAEQLVDAEARENRGQGLIRLRPYVTWMRNGKIASPAKLTVERQFGVTLLLDGGNGWGQVVTAKAMTMCVERAQEHGRLLGAGAQCESHRSARLLCGGCGWRWLCRLGGVLRTSLLSLGRAMGRNQAHLRHEPDRLRVPAQGWPSRCSRSVDDPRLARGRVAGRQVRQIAAGGMGL